MTRVIQHECIMSKLSFKSVLLYQNQNTHFVIFIQGDMIKYILNMYCYSKLFRKVFCKLLVLQYCIFKK